MVVVFSNRKVRHGPTWIRRRRLISMTDALRERPRPLVVRAVENLRALHGAHGSPPLRRKGSRPGRRGRATTSDAAASSRRSVRSGWRPAGSRSSRWRRRRPACRRRPCARSGGPPRSSRPSSRSCRRGRSIRRRRRCPRRRRGGAGRAPESRSPGRAGGRRRDTRRRSGREASGAPRRPRPRRATARYSPGSRTAAASLRARSRSAGPTSVGYSRRSIIPQVGPSTTIVLPASTWGTSTIEVPARAPAQLARSPDSQAGMPQQPRPRTQRTSTPFARSTSTVSRPISGSLLSTEQLWNSTTSAPGRALDQPRVRRPRLERPRRERRQLLVAVDAQRLLQQQAVRGVAVQPVGEAAARAARPAPARRGSRARARAASAPCARLLRPVAVRQLGKVDRERVGVARRVGAVDLALLALEAVVDDGRRLRSASARGRRRRARRRRYANSFGNASQYLKHIRQPAQTSNTRAVSRCSAASSQ